MVTFTVHCSWQSSLLYVNGCALAGAVYFSLLLFPSSPVFVWVESRSSSHFMWAISSETPSQPWIRGYVLEGMSLEVIWHIFEADRRVVCLTLLLLTVNPRRE